MSKNILCRNILADTRMGKHSTHLIQPQLRVCRYVELMLVRLAPFLPCELVFANNPIIVYPTVGAPMGNGWIPGDCTEENSSVPSVCTHLSSKLDAI